MRCHLHHHHSKDDNCAYADKLRIALVQEDDDSPRASSHPRAREMILEDLAQRQPAFVMDLSPVRQYQYPMAQYPLRGYPEIAEQICSNYVRVAEIDSVIIWERADRDTTRVLPATDSVSASRPLH